MITANSLTKWSLVQRIKSKLAEDAEAVREMRKLYREVEAADAGDQATMTHPDIKDRKLFFRNVRGRWCIENKMQE